MKTRSGRILTQAGLEVAQRKSDRNRFRVAFKRFDSDLETGSFRSGLRVKRVEGTGGVFEMTWAPDGRATFEYGTPEGRGAHITWRRIGR